jgi:hypothetical protein
MGVDPLETEWEDFKPSTRDSEYVKKIKEVCTAGVGVTDGSYENSYTQNDMLKNNSD